MRSFRESGHRHSARNARGGENHPGWSSVTRCLRTILAPLSPSPSLFFSPLSTLSSTNIFFSLPFLPSLSPPFLLTRLSFVFFLLSFFLSLPLYLQFFQRGSGKIPLSSRKGRRYIAFSFLHEAGNVKNDVKIIVVQRSFSRRGSSTSMGGKLASLCSGRGMVEAVHRLAP